MGKSFWIKDEDQKGNFSNDKKDTFDRTKNYIGIRLQQGVPLLDRDWNELEDIRRYNELMLRRHYIGNGSPDDGFKICAIDTPKNNFIISAGRCMVDGFEVINDTDQTYDDLNGNNSLTTPSADRIDTVYLDVWIEEWTKNEDPDFENTVDVKVETCVRHKLMWRVRIHEGNEKEYDKEDLHHYFELAKITRKQGISKISNEDIQDVRISILKLNKLNNINLRGKYALNARIMKVPLLRQTLFGRTVPAATIQVGGNLWGIAFDDTHMWVTNHSRHNVSKIDINNNTVVATFAGGKEPNYIDFDGSHIWVTNGHSDFINKIDINNNNNSMDEKFNLGNKTICAAYDGTYMWVANYLIHSVSKIDINNGNVVKTVAVGSNPIGMAFDGTSMWVANKESNNVTKIDINSNTVVTIFSVGIDPYYMAFDGTYMWVTNSKSNNVMKIDINSNLIVASVLLGSESGPIDIAFDGIYIWVTCSSNSTVSKIDINSNKVVATIPVNSPRGIAFDGTYMWITTGESVIKMIV